MDPLELESGHESSLPRTRSSDPTSLAEQLTETRIILPGTQVFLAFLVTLPFTSRFQILDGAQRLVFLSTFFATLLAVACFIAPATYHRIARPIRHKERFKLFANALLVAGLVPASLSFVLVTYLVVSVVAPSAAVVATAVMAAVIGGLWWLVPLGRLHDRFPRRRRTRPPGRSHSTGHAAE